MSALAKTRPSAVKETWYIGGLTILSLNKETMPKAIRPKIIRLPIVF